MSLPALRGPFGVTRTMEVWRDEKRVDAFAQTRGIPIELIVWTWAPSADAGRPTTNYLPLEWQRAQRARQGPLFSLLMRRPDVVQPRSMTRGALACEPGTYPVVILRAGLGALSIQYSALAEALGGYGYFVVAFDAPFRSGFVVFPDGRVVTRPANLNPEAAAAESRERLLTLLTDAWTNDVGFVLDRLRQLNAAPSGPFAGCPNLERVGVVGHSLGGTIAAQFCQRDTRCAAGVDLDGALPARIAQTAIPGPFMFVLSDHGEPSDPAERQIRATIDAAYERLPPNGRMLVTLRGADHFMFSDAWLIRSALLRKAFGPKLQPERAHLIVSDRPCLSGRAPQERTARFGQVNDRGVSGARAKPCSLAALRHVWCECVTLDRPGDGRAALRLRVNRESAAIAGLL